MDRRITTFKGNKTNQLCFPDHYAIEVTFHGIPLKSKLSSLGKKYTLWNTNKPNGWNTYKDLTTSNTKLDTIANNPTLDADLIMKTIEKELKSVKFKSFGKVKVRKERKDSKLEKLIEKKDVLLRNNDNDKAIKVKEIDEQICDKLKYKQKKNIEKELERMNKVKETKGASAAVFDLKEKITGKKKNGDEPSMILNPISRKEVFKPSEIVKSLCRQRPKSSHS